MGGNRHNRARVEIDGLLGFIGEMRGAVLHFGHFGLGIVRIDPILIGGLLFPLAVCAPEFFVTGLQARFLRQSAQILHVAFAGIPTYDRTHRYWLPRWSRRCQWSCPSAFRAAPLGSAQT